MLTTGGTPQRSSNSIDAKFRADKLKIYKNTLAYQRGSVLSTLSKSDFDMYLNRIVEVRSVLVQVGSKPNPQRLQNRMPRVL